MICNLLRYPLLKHEAGICNLVSYALADSITIRRRSESNMMIAINPGHYIGEENYDPGACNDSLRLREVDINIAVAQRLYDKLKNTSHDLVYIHRGELWEITKEANEAETDIFISIHCNSAANECANGTEAFYCEGSTEGEQLADLVQEEMTGLGLIDRGTKCNSLYVTRHTDAVAVLVELGFISNTEEGTKLGTEGFQEAAADALVRAITRYLE